MCENLASRWRCTARAIGKDEASPPIGSAILRRSILENLAAEKHFQKRSNKNSSTNTERSAAFVTPNTNRDICKSIIASPMKSRVMWKENLMSQISCWSAAHAIARSLGPASIVRIGNRSISSKCASRVIGRIQPTWTSPRFACAQRSASCDAQERSSCQPVEQLRESSRSRPCRW